MRSPPSGSSIAPSRRSWRPRVALASAFLGLLAPALFACGARSPLDDSDLTTIPAEGGAGGTSQGGAGGTSQGGGQGGAVAPFTCPGLQLQGAPRAITTDTNADHQELLLSLLGGSQDTVVAGVIQATSSAQQGSLRLISFPGFGAWPGSFGPGSTFTHAVLPEQTLLSGGRAPGSLALALARHPFETPGPTFGVVIAPQVSPQGDPGIPYISDSPLGEAFPRALASQGSFLLEIDEFPGNAGHLSVLRRLGTVDDAKTVAYLGCGTTSLVAAVAPVGQDALVAYSSVSADCMTKNPDKPAGTLRLARSQGSVAFANSLDLPASPLAEEDDHLQFLRLAASDRVAWVVYQYEGINALVPGPYLAIPLDLAGKPLAPAKVVLGAGASLRPPTVTVFGDRLVLAYVPPPASQQQGLSIDMWSPDGQLGNIYSIDQQVGAFTGKTALLSGPTNDSLLVGWTETTPAHHQGYLARISCFFP